jgi:hypothetical protein
MLAIIACYLNEKCFWFGAVGKWFWFGMNGFLERMVS